MFPNPQDALPLPHSSFEAAADAIVSGAVAALERLLHDDPELVRARSTREHRATLLHYVSANGVENYRQKTPANAVEVAKLLLDAGAEVDAAADMYGGGSTTLVVDEGGRPSVLNCPIDNKIPGRERPVANHLGIFARRLRWANR